MIYIIQQILPHYRYDVLKYLPQHKYQILYSNVIKEGTLKSVEAHKKNFVEIPIIRLGEKYFQFPFIQFLKNKPHSVVVTPELRNLSFWVLLILKFILRYQLVCWTHGINNKDYYTKKISTAGRLRLLMMKLSDKVITYSEDRAQVLATLLDKPPLVAPNTLDSSTLNSIYYKLQSIDKKKLFNELGWSSSHNHFIYVGRLISDKRLIESIQLYKKISEKNSTPVNFHIIGDGPHRKLLEGYVEQHEIKGVKFYGQIIDNNRIGLMLYLSDLHLHLGYTGLAVVHSLCFGCPIVTSLPMVKDGPYHSPEFVYLDVYNSIVGIDNELVDMVTNTLSNPIKLTSLKINARSTFEEKCDMRLFLNAFANLEKLNE